MKNLVLLIGLFFITVNHSFCQQVIINPDYAFTTESFLIIKKIVLHDTCTIFDFEFKRGPGASFSIPSESYIRDVTKPEKLFIKSAIGVTLNEWETLPESGVYSYQLVFPPIDKSVKTLDYGEANDGGSWFIYDIQVAKPNLPISSPVYQGNWYSVNSGRPEYVFFDSVAIINSKVWNLAKVNNLKKILELELNHGNETKKIYFRTEPKNKASIGDDLASLKFYTHVKPDVRPLSEQREWNYKDNTEPRLTTCSGYVKGIKPRYGKYSGLLIINNALMGDQETFPIDIDDKGKFSVQVPISYPQIAWVNFPFYNGDVYLEPGKETYQVIDMKSDELFMGELSFENESLQIVDSLISLNIDVDNLILEKPATEFKDFLLNHYNTISRNLDDQAQKGIIGAKIANLVKKETQLSIYQTLMNYNALKESAYRRKYKIPRDQKEIDLERTTLPSSYFDFIKTVNYEDPSYLSLVGYVFFISDLINTENIRAKIRLIPVQDLKEFFIKSNIELQEQDLSNLSKIDSIQKSATSYGTDYQFYVNEISNKYEKYMDKIINNYRLDVVLNYLTDSFKIESALLQDIIKSEFCLDEITNKFGPYSPSQLDSVCGRISNNMVSSYIKFKNAETLAKIEANRLKRGYFVNETPQYEGNKLFDAIIAKYKGKVIYVDFWATWCAPCRDGIKNIAPLKDELSGEDVVFLYITGVTSPEGIWKTTIPDIKGEHFRLTKNEWAMLGKEFNIIGIPHYMLVGKSGDIINANLGHMNNESLKKVLLSYVKE